MGQQPYVAQSVNKPQSTAGGPPEGPQSPTAANWPPPQTPAGPSNSSNRWWGHLYPHKTKYAGKTRDELVPLINAAMAKEAQEHPELYQQDVDAANAQLSSPDPAGARKFALAKQRDRAAATVGLKDQELAHFNNDVQVNQQSGSVEQKGWKARHGYLGPALAFIGAGVGGGIAAGAIGGAGAGGAAGAGGGGGAAAGGGGAAAGGVLPATSLATGSAAGGGPTGLGIGAGVVGSAAAPAGGIGAGAGTLGTAAGGGGNIFTRFLGGQNAGGYGPEILKGGIGALGSWLVGRQATKSAQQRSPEELAALAGANKAGDTLSKQGEELYGVGLPYMRQAGTYYSTLLRGDRAAMSQAVAAPRAAITDVYRGAERGLERSNVRGASRDVAAGELARERAGKIAGLTTGVQPYAADQLADLGGKVTTLGQGSAAKAGDLYGDLLRQGWANRVYARGEGEKATGIFGDLLFDAVRSGANKNSGNR